MMGVKQTEIDALITLRPELLEQLAREALAPFFDYTLAARIDKAKYEWKVNAQAALEEQISGTANEVVDRTQACLDDLALAKEDLEAVGDVDDYDLPDLPVAPEAEIEAVAAEDPLMDSEWDWVDATTRLKAEKRYEESEVL